MTRYCSPAHMLWAAILSSCLSEPVKETYFKAMANAPIVVMGEEEEGEVDYDSDGNPIIPERSKVS